MFAVLALGCAAVTGYAYVGYPLLLAWLARARSDGPYEPVAPHVSLIVAAYNESDVIATKLRNIFELDYPSTLLEVIIVTDGSDDGTEAVARSVAQDRAIVLHEASRSGKAAAMTRGVAAASGEIVVFSDANNLYPDNALREVVAPFGDPDVGAVTGAKSVGGGAAEVSGGEKLYWRYESYIKRQESKLGCCTGVIGELLAVRRELVPDLPAGLVNDDFYIAMQVARGGRKVAYSGAALSVEPTSASLAADAIRRRRISAGRWQSVAWWRITVPLDRPRVVWQLISHKYLRLVLPFTMLGAFVGSGLDVARSPRRLRKLRLAAFFGQCAFYALAIMGGRVSRPRAARSAASAARYVVSSNLSSAQGLGHYLRHRHEMHLWERVGRAVAGDPGDEVNSLEDG